MRPWTALLAAVLLAAALAACGEGTKTTASTPAGSGQPPQVDATVGPTGAPHTVTRGYVWEDGDHDDDDEERNRHMENDDQSLFETYGSSATPGNTRAIGALVRAYLTAVAASNGTAGCGLLDATLARSFVEYGAQAGGAKHKNCAEALSLLFGQQRPRLTPGSVATMTVINVYVKGRIGLAELGFRTTPEQQLTVEREGGTWKIGELLGSDLT